MGRGHVFWIAENGVLPLLSEGGPTPDPCLDYKAATETTASQEAAAESPQPPGSTMGPPSTTVTPPALELRAVPSVDQKRAAVKLKASLAGSGTLSWTLTFKGTTGQTNVFGKGTRKVPGASTPTLTIKPTAAALRALKRAREHGHALSVKAVLTFDPSSGASPVSLERSIIVRWPERSTARGQAPRTQRARR